MLSMDVIPEEQKYFFAGKISTKCVIEMIKLFREKILWVLILILFSLAGSCSTKKTTEPVQPTGYLMKDYFPLNGGDEWIWEVESVRHSVPEPYADGDINLGEPFLDINANGVYDHGELFEDLNGDGDYDGPDDLWTPGIPYEDRNGNGEYDAPNGKWDEGELFADLNGDGIWNATQQVGVGRLKAGVGAATFMSSDGSVIFGRGSSFLGPPGWSFLDWPYTDDGFSNDSLGLR
jgi:hypothetical protein